MKKPPIHLTPRQREVLEAIWGGVTSRKIGEHFHLSVRTVEVHRFALMKKLGATNTAQLVRAALNQGLIEL